MLHLVLWPILAVWAGLALVALLSIVSMLLWGTAHLLHDRRGIDGEVWCPVHDKNMQVHGLPRRFLEHPFTDLSRCEHWRGGRVACDKRCVKWPDVAHAVAGH